MTDENARPRRSRAGGKPDTQLMPPPEQVDDHRRDLLKDLIRQQVLHDLGEPVGLLRVQVRPLWDDHYRVNVFVGDVTTPEGRAALEEFVTELFDPRP